MSQIHTTGQTSQALDIAPVTFYCFFSTWWQTAEYPSVFHVHYALSFRITECEYFVCVNSMAIIRLHKQTSWHSDPVQYSEHDTTMYSLPWTVFVKKNTLTEYLLAGLCALVFPDTADNFDLFCMIYVHMHPL